MPKQVIEKEGFVDVTTTVVGKQKKKGGRMKIRPFVTDTANVSVKYGLTIPTQEYGSARGDVMISCPCYKEEIVEMYGQLKDIVAGLISKEADRITGEE